MFGLGLRPLQEALNRKADEVQREFIDLGNQIEEMGKQLLELSGEDKKKLREEQLALRARQQKLAEDINMWRERSRQVMRQAGRESLRAYVTELTQLDEKSIQPAAEQVLRLMDMPPEEIMQLEGKDTQVQEQTPAGRLLERARVEYDMRTGEPSVRLREAVAFANRPGMAQDDAMLDEIAEAMDDPDPLVREVAILTTIQLHRFRAMRMADLDQVHRSTQYLANMNHAAVIPTLIEVLGSPRSGFVIEDGESKDANNDRSRMVALLRLVEWHTAEAQAAIQARRFDQDEHIVKAAERALELFPGPWSGPLKGAPQ